MCHFGSHPPTDDACLQLRWTSSLARCRCSGCVSVRLVLFGHALRKPRTYLDWEGVLDCVLGSRLHALLLFVLRVSGQSKTVSGTAEVTTFYEGHASEARPSDLVLQDMSGPKLGYGFTPTRRACRLFAAVILSLHTCLRTVHNCLWHCRGYNLLRRSCKRGPTLALRKSSQ